jgi:hypothetical protein
LHYLKEFKTQRDIKQSVLNKHMGAQCPHFIIGYKMANLRILKLSTGEEIVGDIVEETADKYRMENPCVLAIGMNQAGKAALQMQPLLIFSEQKVVEFNPNHIIYNVTVAQEIKNKYNEIYGSGIVLPPSQGIIT